MRDVCISIKIELADATHNGIRFPNWQQTSGQICTKTGRTFKSQWWESENSTNL